MTDTTQLQVDVAQTPDKTGIIVYEGPQPLDIHWDSSTPVNEVLETLRSVTCGYEPQSLEQHVAVLQAALWAMENPDQAPVVEAYLGTHFPWWNGSGYRVGDMVTIGNALHETMEMMITSVSRVAEGMVMIMGQVAGQMLEQGWREWNGVGWRMGQFSSDYPFPSQPRRPEPEQIPDGRRARKGQVQQRKHWQQFSKGRRGQSFKTRKPGRWRV